MCRFVANHGHYHDFACAAFLAHTLFSVPEKSGGSKIEVAVPKLDFGRGSIFWIPSGVWVRVRLRLRFFRVTRAGPDLQNRAP